MRQHVCSAFTLSQGSLKRVTSAAYEATDHQQNQGADDTTDDACEVQVIDALSGEQTCQRAAKKAPTHSENAGHDEPHWLPARHEAARDQTDDKTKENEEKNAHE